MLLLGALALRLIIAYVLFPRSGFETDIGTFTSWATTLANHGPDAFYDSVGFADYLPGYLYVLWLLGMAGQAIAPIAGADPGAVTVGLLKLPPIFADIAIGWVLHRLARRWLGDRSGAERLSLVVAALYVFNPATWYDAALWGQVDSVGVLVALLAVALLIEGQEEFSTALTVLALLIKPQLAVVLLPILGAVLLRRHVIRPGSGPRLAWGPAFLRRWALQEHGAWRLVSSAVAGVAVLYAVITPFHLDLFGLAKRLAMAAGTYPHLTVNAYNPWAFVGSAGLQPMAFAGLGRWSPDAAPLVGPLSGAIIGTGLLAIAVLIPIGQLLRRADKRSILLAAAYLSLAYFLIATRVHERYLFPIFVFLPLLALYDWRLLVATIVVGLTTVVNLHGILTETIWGTPNVENLALGELSRDPLVIGLCVVAAVVLFLVLALRSLAILIGRRDVFRSGTATLMAMGGHAAMRPSEPPPPQVASGRAAPRAGAVTPAPWLEKVGAPPPDQGLESRRAVALSRPRAMAAGPGPVTSARELRSAGSVRRLRWAFAARLGSRPLRGDRSAALAGEPPGRVDRLDLLLILLVVFVALVLRAWRVGEPPDMYFDEVYHARTATEFLQDWRYGQPHPIYEYTHPHLAKYLIAAGLVAFGKNEVSATTELGYAARDAVVETAWDPASGSGTGGGDRLYVSGPGGVRVYDLASRALVATIPLGDGAEPGPMAVDASTHRLLVADLAGRLWAVDTPALDALRTGADARSLPAAFALGNLGGPVRTMVVDTTASVILAALDDGHIVTLDAGTGASIAATTVPGAADVASVAGGERLVVDALAAPSTEADTLAGLIGEDAASVRDRLAGASGDVIVAASLTTDQRDAVQAAIDKGTLTASRFETGRLAVVAAIEGLVLLDLDTLARSQAFPMKAPAIGVTFVDKVSTPTLYVATGSELDRIELPADSPPVHGEPIWMPGPVRAVLFDPATKLIHALGARPDGQGETVYVVEPHANAVYADAPLPEDPVTWALDAQPDHPGADREQLLAIAADGSLAVVEVGGNAFGWRFPGVIAGALMAGFLYLLARLLVRRRLVALLVAGLVLLDGMAFAQARIAMNDTYVGLFVVAAYAIFAALWLGVWRGKGAVLLGLPLVGVLLGLALAAKWVGLYAIGGIVLLVLLRSALGRVLALLAMIAMSGVLGWLAISEPSSGSPGVVGMSVATALVALVTLLVLRRLGAGGTLIAAGTLFASITAAVLLLVKGDALFLVFMVALTLTLAVFIVLRPVFLTLEELRFGVIVPGIAGAIVGLGSIILRDRLPPAGLLSSTSLLIVGILLVGVGIGAYTVVAVAGRRGLGPLAPLPEPDAPEARLKPAGPAPEGWLLPGWRLGIPWLWALLCFTAVPLAIYVASYIPWVALGNRWTETFPAGHTGQTFLDLQISMYQYHNNLRATHAASSPWWAWPLDLKPVWFYLGSSGGRTALIYDAGNLVIFWLSVPAMLWTAWTAWRRRSLALGLVVIAFAAQWLAWSRVDRATFQYHYYTSLPFVLIALAYFLSELWHGPSARTWLFARITVAATIVATPILWLLRDPLCAVSGVLRVNATSQACGYVRESFVLSDRAAIALVVLAVGTGVIAWRRRRMTAAALGPDGAWSPDRGWRAFSAWLVGTMLVTAAALFLVIAVVPEAPLIAAPIGLIAWYLVAAALLIPFAYAAWVALGVRDARRYVVGVFVAAGLWFIIFYPDIGALPVPTGLARLFQVLPLPTYNYDFQFAVNTAAAVPTPILSVEALALAGMVAFLALAAMYATWTWRLATAAEAAARDVEADAAVA